MNRVLNRFAQASRILLYGEPRVPVKPEDITPLTPEQVAEARRFFPLKKFFIFGHARSGTTLLARLIRVHPEIYCNWQAHFFTRAPLLASLVSSPEVSEWLTRPSNRWNRGGDLSPVVMRAASDFILERSAREAKKSVVGDKSPNNLTNGDSVRWLNLIYPDATLFYLVRDGRDAIISHRIQKFIDLSDQLTPQEEMIRKDLIEHPEQFHQGHRSIFTMDDLRRAVHGWVRNVQETDRLGKEFYGDKYLGLRFEDLLADPQVVMRQVWSCLGVGTELPELAAALDQEFASNPDADWQRQKDAEIAEKIRKGVPGSWQTILTQEDREIFKGIAGETLIEWGYEQDINW